MSLFISAAYAAEGTGLAQPGAGEAVMMNILFIIILVMLFYVLLIMPQKKRFKMHQEMMGGLKKGDKVLTTSGFIGKVDKIEKDGHEIVIDLGSNVKVTAVRSAVQDVIKEK